MREVRVLCDLRELPLEQSGELGGIQVAVELDVANEKCRNVVKGVPVTEAEDLLEVCVAAPWRQVLLGVAVLMMVAEVRGELLLTIETVPFNGRPDTVLRRYIRRCSPNRTFSGLASAPTAADVSLARIVILSQTRDELIRTLVIAVASEYTHGLSIVSRDRRTKILVTALRQIVHMHIQDALGLGKLLFLGHLRVP